jgi:hypothetical protein
VCASGREARARGVIARSCISGIVVELTGSELAGLPACTGTGRGVLSDLDDGGDYLTDFRPLAVVVEAWCRCDDVRAPV